jgi:hypothetical protein
LREHTLFAAEIQRVSVLIPFSRAASALTCFSGGFILIIGAEPLL